MKEIPGRYLDLTYIHCIFPLTNLSLQRGGLHRHAHRQVEPFLSPATGYNNCGDVLSKGRVGGVDEGDGDDGRSPLLS